MVDFSCWLEAWLWLSAEKPTRGFFTWLEVPCNMVAWFQERQRQREGTRQSCIFFLFLTLEVVEHHFCSTPLFEAGMSLLKFKRKEHRLCISFFYCFLVKANCTVSTFQNLKLFLLLTYTVSFCYCSKKSQVRRILFFGKLFFFSAWIPFRILSLSLEFRKY